VYCSVRHTSEQPCQCTSDFVESLNRKVYTVFFKTQKAILGTLLCQGFTRPFFFRLHIHCEATNLKMDIQ